MKKRRTQEGRTLRKEELAYVPLAQETYNLAEESDSDDEVLKNRIGNVPLEWYDEEDHIGYDIKGSKIMRKEHGDNIDALLSRTDDPDHGRKVYDALNDEMVTLSTEEMSMINRLRKGKFPHRDFDPYKDYLGNFFTSTIQKEAFGNPREPKRRFTPSKHEAKRIVKLIHALRNGWIKTTAEREQAADEPSPYLIWTEDQGEEERKKGAPPSIPPPRAKLPGHAESYNPPPEYLPTQEELNQWAALPARDRPYDFVPAPHNRLLDVGSYENGVKERFERCLDLYMCARVRKRRLNVDPDSLIPKLPKPSDLRPFPTTLTIEYLGHKGRVRSISVSPTGQWMASGGDDKVVRLWEVSTGRCVRRWVMESIIECVTFNPNATVPLLAVACGTQVCLLPTKTGTKAQEAALVELYMQAFAMATAHAAEQEQLEAESDAKTKKKSLSSWTRSHEPPEAENDEDVPQPIDEMDVGNGPEDGDEGRGRETNKGQEKKEEKKNIKVAKGVVPTVYIDIGKMVKTVTWHGKGDYLASASPEASATAVLIHRLSHAKTQSPFRKSKGMVQRVCFHPLKPFFLVAAQRHIYIYNLATEKLVKKLLCPARWISSLSVHSNGDHVICGSYDRRVCWYDLDLSAKPFQSLRYHSKAVRQTIFHPRCPLFASCSDDGSLHVFHATVYTDLLTNPLIVPVKILKAHKVAKGLGVLDCHFHPTQPWLFSAGADAAIRLFT